MNSEFVYINEVGPRDGLQNQKTILGTTDRLNLISLLMDANIPGIEVASFVNPKAVPAMAGAHEIIDGLQETKNCDISVLVPNMKGFELAQAAGANHVFPWRGASAIGSSSCKFEVVLTKSDLRLSGNAGA